MAKIGTPSRREAIFHQNARWRQDGRRRAPNGPKWRQDGPKMASSWAQNGSQDGPKTAQNEHRVSTRRSFLNIVYALSIRRCFHAFSKKRTSPRRGAHFGRPLGRETLSGELSTALHFHLGRPDAPKTPPGPPPRRAQAQKRRLASTRRSFC